ncbi:MAG: hypothetical protein K2X87_21400 [Gemmataceae bacterium]|nr:hypothetical protein [Gemmataceae bacterium]
MPADLAVLIGLDPPEAKEPRSRVARPVVSYPMPPKLQLRAGELHTSRTGSWDWDGPVGAVVFHGIFEDDLPAFATLALWGGRCLPSAYGMLDCRPRIANLARVRRVSRFAGLPRGYADAGTTFAAGPTVAKWGEWHCGEGKERVAGDWPAAEPTLFEPFLEGQAVRVTAVGDRLWQLRLGGDDWKKSIHHADAAFVDLDLDLAADVQALRDHFDLAVCAADYVVSSDGAKPLLELNPIPNVTQFAGIRAAYLDHAAAWLDAG